MTKVTVQRNRSWHLRAMLLACALGGACSSTTEPSVTSPSAAGGEWSGTTAQGMPFAFTVSLDEKVTSITVGHRFSACSGSRTFSNLNLPTVPDVICIPGPCSTPTRSYRSFAFSDGRFGEAQTTVFGLFLPGNRAQGQVNFTDFAACGSAVGVPWIATRR